VIVVQVRVWARFFQNLNPSVPVLSHFLKSKNLQSLDMVRFHVPAFPNAKDCVSTKF
jgi:hypothetical protein